LVTLTFTIGDRPERETTVPDVAVKPIAEEPVTVGVDALGTAAFAATVDSKPKPNADTATSAMRLIDVFVDIIFLSIVEFGTIPISALR